MTNTSLLLTEINKNYETLTALLSKAKAMTDVALLCEKFAEQPETTKHHYWWLLGDVLEEAVNLNEQLLSQWYQHTREFKE
jgi:hypothetical protein